MALCVWVCVCVCNHIYVVNIFMKNTTKESDWSELAQLLISNEIVRADLTGKNIEISRKESLVTI